VHPDDAALDAVVHFRQLRADDRDLGFLHQEHVAIRESERQEGIVFVVEEIEGLFGSGAEPREGLHEDVAVEALGVRQRDLDSPTGLLDTIVVAHDFQVSGVGVHGEGRAGQWRRNI